MSTIELFEPPNDAVDRVKAQTFDELKQALNTIVTDLEAAEKEGPANYALRYGQLRGEIQGLLTRFGMFNAIADGLRGKS